MHFLSLLAGALLCNSIPHLAAGLQGKPFPTPYAKPPGIGDSSAVVNVLWGSFNLFAGVFTLGHNSIAIGFNWDFGALCVGFLGLGLHLARHFSRVKGDR